MIVSRIEGGLGNQLFQLAFGMQLSAVHKTDLSNEIDWCVRELDFGCPTYFVDHNDAMTGYEDLLLMTAAESVVMANSTFSWWGAYLNERPNAKIYSPSHWFKPNTLNDQDIACEAWTPCWNAGKGGCLRLFRIIEIEIKKQDQFPRVARADNI